MIKKMVVGVSNTYEQAFGKAGEQQCALSLRSHAHPVEFSHTYLKELNNVHVEVALQNFDLAGHTLVIQQIQQRIHDRVWSEYVDTYPATCATGIPTQG